MVSTNGGTAPEMRSMRRNRSCATYTRSRRPARVSATRSPFFNSMSTAILFYCTDERNAQSSQEDVLPLHEVQHRFLEQNQRHNAHFIQDPHTQLRQSMEGIQRCREATLAPHVPWRTSHRLRNLQNTLLCSATKGALPIHEVLQSKSTRAERNEHGGSVKGARPPVERVE